jgi:hypothetical protein
VYWALLILLSSVSRPAALTAQTGADRQGGGITVAPFVAAGARITERGVIWPLLGTGGYLEVDVGLPVRITSSLAAWVLPLTCDPPLGPDQNSSQCADNGKWMDLGGQLSVAESGMLTLRMGAGAGMITVGEPYRLVYGRIGMSVRPHSPVHISLEARYNNTGAPVRADQVYATLGLHVRLR